MSVVLTSIIQLLGIAEVGLVGREQIFPIHFEQSKRSNYYRCLQDKCAILDLELKCS